MPSGVSARPKNAFAIASGAARSATSWRQSKRARIPPYCCESRWFSSEA
jgi:hypothetical protein